ncbi:YqaA family protein [Azonexus caeni]|jgi:membrane protein YqaA with SNARE-associated domain|uniref:YqaA family protein n=1 Tax=Azonexus caeni TaxID=266126 RepID=UPI003A87BFAB
MLTGFDPGAGLWGLGLYSLLAATLLPGGSELALYAFLKYAPTQAHPALLVATLGNTLGGLISWACGRFLPRWQRVERLPQVDRLRRWGAAALLFSWLPLIGDALCIAAGWLRLHWLPCALFMALGKFARYWLVVQAATN